MIMLVVLISIMNPLFSQRKKYQFLKRDTIHKKEGFFLFPLLYYTPDTRFAAGLIGIYYFNTAKENSIEKTRLSYAKLLGDYTQNKQLDFWSSWYIFTNEEKYLFKGELRYRNFPDKFFGIGNSTLDSQKENYSYDLIKLKLLGMKQLAKRLFVGFDYQFEKGYNFILSPDGELIKGSITGYKGGVGSALGSVITYDTRDNVVNAYSGHYMELSSYFNSNYLGANFNYINLNFEFSKYWEVAKNQVIAVQFVANTNFGGVPFVALAKAGNDGLLRGYASNRFRDLHFAGAQVEYRFPLFWRFGATVFTGVGEVFSKSADIKINNLKYSIGGGLRFAINQKERLNARFDYGFGRKSDAFYIMLTEAF